jgi:hypothetical protein
LFHIRSQFSMNSFGNDLRKSLPFIHIIGYLPCDNIFEI